MVDTMIGHTMLQWACIMCTLLMDFSVVYCVACGTRQPRNRIRFCRVQTPEIPVQKCKKRMKSKEKKKKRGRPRTKVIYLNYIIIMIYNLKNYECSLQNDLPHVHCIHPTCILGKSPCEKT